MDSLVGWQVAPAVAAPEILLPHLSLAEATGNFAFIHRPACGPLLTAAASSGRAPLPLVLLLLFEVGDELVERLDHARLHAANLGAGMAKIKPAANVSHSSGDVVKRVRFDAGDVGG